MSLYINVKLFGIAAFMIGFIVFAAGQLLTISPTSAFKYELLPETVVVNNKTYYDQTDYYDINYKIAKEEYLTGNSLTKPIYYSSSVVMSDELLQYLKHFAGDVSKEIYGSSDFDDDNIEGYYWFTTYFKTELIYGAAGRVGEAMYIYNQFPTSYDNYVKIKTGDISGMQPGFGGIRAIVNILTFNFNDAAGNEIPLNIRIIAGLFMIPLYTILLISVLPLIALLITAMTSGNIIFAVIKSVTILAIVGGLLVFL